MQRKQWRIHIDAPREKVWQHTISKASFKKWTLPFAPSSPLGKEWSYEGEWKEGETIYFIDGSQKERTGMISEVIEYRPPAYTSLKHTGILTNGEEDYDSEQAKAWLPSHESYTLNEKDGGTEFIVEQDAVEEHLEILETNWPKALQILKALAEG